MDNHPHIPPIKKSMIERTIHSVLRIELNALMTIFHIERKKVYTTTTHKKLVQSFDWLSKVDVMTAKVDRANYLKYNYK